MASTKRMNQIAATIQRELSIVLQQEGSYIYGRALVTVTSVNMTPDLGLARVYLSVYNVEDKTSVVESIQREVKRLRQGLAHRVKRHMRRVPLIEFYEDDTLDEMLRLQKVFKSIEADKTKETEEGDTSNNESAV